MTIISWASCLGQKNALEMFIARKIAFTAANDEKRYFLQSQTTSKLLKNDQINANDFLDFIITAISNRKNWISFYYCTYKYRA